MLLDFVMRGKLTRARLQSVGGVANNSRGHLLSNPVSSAAGLFKALDSLTEIDFSTDNFDTNVIDLGTLRPSPLVKRNDNVTFIFQFTCDGVL